MTKPQICNDTTSPFVVETPDGSCCWLVPVDSKEAILKPDCNHAYITPDDTIWVLDHDRSKLIEIGSATVYWGDIKGNLYDQPDLTTALNAKASKASPAIAGNIAVLTSDGSYQDGGINPANLASKSDLNAYEEKSNKVEISASSTDQQYPTASSVWNLIQNVIADIPAGGLKIPISVDLESNLPDISTLEDGDYFFIQNMDESSPDHTGRAWVNTVDGTKQYFKVIDQYQHMDGISIVQNGAGAWEVSTTWLNGVLENMIPDSLPNPYNLIITTVGDGAPVNIIYNGSVARQVTISKLTIGLDNVNNTSDADKPVSTAQQEALNGKADNMIYTDGNLQLTSNGTAIGDIIAIGGGSEELLLSSGDINRAINGTLAEVYGKPYRSISIIRITDGTTTYPAMVTGYQYSATQGAQLAQVVTEDGSKSKLFVRTRNGSTTTPWQECGGDSNGVPTILASEVDEIPYSDNLPSNVSNGQLYTTGDDIYSDIPDTNNENFTVMGIHIQDGFGWQIGIPFSNNGVIDSLYLRTYHSGGTSEWVRQKSADGTFRILPSPITINGFAQTEFPLNNGYKISSIAQDTNEWLRKVKVGDTLMFDDISQITNSDFGPDWTWQGTTFIVYRIEVLEDSNRSVILYTHDDHIAFANTPSLHIMDELFTILEDTGDSLIISAENMQSETNPLGVVARTGDYFIYKGDSEMMGEWQTPPIIGEVYVVMGAQPGEKFYQCVRTYKTLGSSGGGYSHMIQVDLYANDMQDIIMATFTLVCDKPSFANFAELTEYIHSLGFETGSAERYYPCNGTSYVAGTIGLLYALNSAGNGLGLWDITFYGLDGSFSYAEGVGGALANFQDTVVKL